VSSLKSSGGGLHPLNNRFGKVDANGSISTGLREVHFFQINP
jgi:hypothetical protein